MVHAIQTSVWANDVQMEQATVIIVWLRYVLVIRFVCMFAFVWNFRSRANWFMALISEAAGSAEYLCHLGMFPSGGEFGS